MPDFAERLANALGLPFRLVTDKVTDNRPQKDFVGLAIHQAQRICNAAHSIRHIRGPGSSSLRSAFAKDGNGYDLPRSW